MSSQTSLEELLRAELAQVASAAVVPARPDVREHDRRRRWIPLVAAAAVLLLVVGIASLLRDRRPEPAPVDPPKRVQVDTSAPTVPWLDGDKLYVDGRQVPGRWVELIAAGDTWLARRRDLHVVWGRDGARHDLGLAGEVLSDQRFAYPLRGHGPFLSSNGDWLVVGSDAEHDRSARVVLVDTSTGRSRTMTIPPPHGVGGVTDEGLVLVGPRLVGPDGASRSLDLPKGFLLRANGAEGFVLDQHEQQRRWAVAIEGRSVRRVVETTHASLSLDRRWLLDLAWAEDRREPTALAITSLETGDTTSSPAPKGWVFAPQLAPGFWEPAGTLVTWVVDPDTRAYRLARCAPAAAECVLVEQS